VTGIHHPAGDVKKISADSDDVDEHTEQQWANFWFVEDWETGTTEGGSSGSVLLNDDHHVIGQLFGGTSPVCDENKSSVYGMFDHSWDQNGGSSPYRLKDWLDPAGDDPTTLDGMWGLLPPQPPTSFSITNPTSIGLPPQMSWTASTSANIDYYEVYRCPSYYRNCFSYGSTIGTTGGTSFTDMTVEILEQESAWDRFSYRVTAVSDDDVDSAPSNWSSVWGDPTFKRGLGDELPGEFALDQNYPNPFNPLTVITYSVPDETPVSLIIYDEAGREVETLVDELRSAGQHRVSFDARHLASGVYYYQLRAGSKYISRRMTLIR